MVMSSCSYCSPLTKTFIYLYQLGAEAIKKKKKQINKSLDFTVSSQLRNIFKKLIVSLCSFASICTTRLFKCRAMKEELQFMWHFMILCS